VCEAHVRSSDLTGNPERRGIKTVLTLEMRCLKLSRECLNRKEYGHSVTRDSKVFPNELRFS
jgi:hypothetical protein